jgi:hypothetical protein
MAVAMMQSDLAGDAQRATLPAQVSALARWVGDGRKLTQTGRLTMADARELVSLLDTGDEIDPVIGSRTFRTRSSEDLRQLNIVLAWAKAASLVRIQHGRLQVVKKNAALADRPLDLWVALFEALDRIGAAICPSGWYASVFGEMFPQGVAVLFTELSHGGGSVSFDEVCERVWQELSPFFRLDGATQLQLDFLRN